MKDGKIPGASVVIVEGNKTLYSKGFGYSNLKEKRAVNSKTLFELGSVSKAFTALGIRKLEKDGLIHLDDPVNMYIPWFQMKYVGNHRGETIDGYVDITLRQLLHHTSGIPFNSIGDIPIDESDDALEKTVRTQVGKKLEFYPGEKYLYATINYDILGLVIKNVSQMPYEDYMKKHVIEALGINNTYLSRDEAAKYDLADGYKVKFLKQFEYAAPTYRGNTPAGYIITNAEDLAKWIKIQLGTEVPITFDKDLIEISHLPDRTVDPSNDGSSYASGWSVYQSGGGKIAHDGSNPNYSSEVTFRPQFQYGIGILTNSNSEYTNAIANGIDNIILGVPPKGINADTNLSIDNASFTIVIITFPIIIITMILLLLLIVQVIQRKRVYIGDSKKAVSSFVILSIFIIGIGYCMYRIPDILYWGLPWSFIEVWAPQSLIIGVISIFSTIVVFCIYYFCTVIFPKKKEKSIFIISVLSVISGFGNAIIIFIVNEALNRTQSFQTGLLLFFFMGIVFYVFGQRIVRIRLLKLTNELVYTKRIQLINKILKSSYEKIEKLENGKIHAGLNNDTETISHFANIVITAATSLVTLICCFVYLGIINFYGMLISLGVIIVATGFYFLVGTRANKLWEETRNIQNVFFSFISSLLGGFKELKMNTKRQSEFREEMQASCEQYRDKRIKGELGFANGFVVGELLFTFVIGVVAFVFPIVFNDIETGTLRNYIFVFLYMTGPVHGVLESIPEIIRTKISYQRLISLIEEIDSTEKSKMEETLIEGGNLSELTKLELHNVEYLYKNGEGEEFQVGPVSCTFQPGEITFITGGNGSGKSTLAKLITGLYQPDKGEITVNNHKVTSEVLSQSFSTVMSDYFLFEKLYGIDYTVKAERITELLKKLRFEDKLSIKNGVFSTTKLSSGQRKRLALMVSYLEDRNIYIFDEWAADQDPEFRSYFYEHLLPELRQKGKCIIAITHDDRYYSIADKVIKMEMGRMVE
ncbi:cyclic peptide export ABC transporter [Paenibacillus amylolyticus]